MKMNYEVILVDDDPVNNFLNEKIVNKFNPWLHIKSFEQPAEAFKYLLATKNETHRKSFLFLDLNMPEMDGWQFLENLKNHFEQLNLQVYILTSSINFEDKNRACNNSLVEAFLTKPLVLRKLEGLLPDFNDITLRKV